LLAWERPWRRRYLRPTAKAPVTAALPAYAALAWDDGAAAGLLLPDHGAVPLRLYRPTLDHVLVLRGLHGGALPTLVVATTDAGRVAAWRALVEEVRAVRSEAPLSAAVGTWAELRTAPQVLAVCATDQAPEGLVQRVQLPPLWRRDPAAPLPRFVGDALAPPVRRPRRAPAGTGRDRVALSLSRADRGLLDLVGRHPFLPSASLALVLDWPLPAVLRRRNRLIAAGLLRVLDRAEAAEDGAGDELVEATAQGLTLVAAQLGLTLSGAVRALGLAGGGPEQPIGARRALLKHPTHTREADDVFVRLFRTARRRTAAGWDDALIEWRSAAACCRRPIRPDGYGIYRHAGRPYGLFLEYDRGTMSARDYLQKFAAYYAYWASGRYERDYDGFPTILVVTRDSTAEERIARAAVAAAVGRGQVLPLLLTCRWRIDSRRNPGGLLGPIWREPGSTTRRCWPAVARTGGEPVLPVNQRILPARPARLTGKPPSRWHQTPTQAAARPMGSSPCESSR
jgi:hypothetical protein